MADIGLNLWNNKGLRLTISCADSVTLDYLLRVSDFKIWIGYFSNLFPLFTGEEIE